MFKKLKNKFYTKVVEKKQEIREKSLESLNKN